MVTENIKPNTIRHLQRAVYPASALLAGIQLNLFTVIGQDGKSVQEIADEVGLDYDKLQSLLYVLVLSDLLRVENDTFFNTEESHTFLVIGGESYIGDEYEAFVNSRWTTIGKTAQSVKTGVAGAKIDYSAMSKTDLENFYLGNHSQNQRVGRDLASKFDFSRYKRLMDVAGGTGGLAITIASNNPDLKATVIEQSNVVPVVQRFIDESRSSESVSVLALDITQEVPAQMFDVAIMKNFIPVISRNQAKQALINIGQSLEQGGKLFMIDMGMLDDSRVAPRDVVINGLFFLNVFDNGGPRTESERREWLCAAGFQKIERFSWEDGLGLMVAEKA